MYWPLLTDHQLKAEECHVLVIHAPQPLSNKTAAKSQRQGLIAAILKKYTTQPFTIKTAPQGKPYLDSNEIAFNYSHSHHILVLAISRYPVGIDIEWMKKKDYQGFSNYFWGADLISMYPRYAQRLAFFQAWTQTEAWVKYHGETIFNHQHFIPTTLLARDPISAHHCQMLSFMPLVNTVASLCYEKHIQTITLKHLDWSAIHHASEYP